jgi:hypothetical protein
MESIMANGIERLMIGAAAAIGIVALSASTIGRAVALTAVEGKHLDGGYASQNAPQQDARPERDCEDAASSNKAPPSAIEEASEGLVAVCGRTNEKPSKQGAAVRD